MFYVDDILKKRGKFGLIWLAATGRKLTSRDVWSVDVVGSSHNIKDVLNKEYTLPGYRSNYSLYLSSQLTYGLVKIQSRKTQLLLADIITIRNRLYAFKTPIETSNIDLQPSTDHPHLNLLSPNMSDVSLGFGCLAPFPEPAEHMNIDFFLVTTPQSSEEELLLTPPGGLFGLPGMAEGAELLHTSARSDVTMEEPIQEVQPEDPFGAPDEGNVDLLAGPMGFMPPGDVPDLPAREEIPEVPQPPPFPPQSPPQPPIPPAGGALRDSPQGSIARGSGSSDSQGPPDVPGALGPPVLQPAPPMSPVRPRRRQPPPADDDDEEFVLDPVVLPGPRRRRRRRHLVVDTVTVISPDEMRNRMRGQVDNDELFRRFREEITRPRRLSAAELFGRFNTRVVPAPFRDIFRRLRTLPEPNFPDFRIVDEEEEPLAVVEELPADELPVLDQDQPPLQPPIVEEQPIEEEIFDEAEVRRARETFEATMDPSAGRMVTGSSLQVPDASSATLHRTRDVTVSPGRPSMLHLDDDIELMDDVPRTRFDHLEDLREAQIGQDIHQPEADIEREDVSEEQEIPAPVRTRAPVCQYSPVSPVPSPPLSSFASLSEPLGAVLDFIKHHAVDGVLYFEQLIKLELPDEKKRKRRKVAILFNLIIRLAAERKIELEQIIHGESIRITLPKRKSEGPCPAVKNVRKTRKRKRTI
ncbi:hypothetical protein JTE90_013222 [Oedothorax gibbosus]|uniref:Rad21/Rec8-like protein N-terminal domain-containing protein n=1 Tax=Oedothorax gibbosus TaxID=931172 RepID=A0AAV6VCV1_9ARAC|nr:hypothetical protein JTE90_013222 [Oedothorax gibbosus]